MDVALARERALLELDRPNSDVTAIAHAQSSLMSDLPNHGANRLGIDLIMAGLISTRDDMRKHIEGYR